MKASTCSPYTLRQGDFGGPGRFAFSRAMMQELEGLRDHADCRERILADWRRFVVGTAPVLLEKSPPNLTKIWWLRSVFPDSRFVVVTRDPRAVAAATQKWSGTSLTELMLHWNTAYSHALDDFRVEDSIHLRYEDLTAHPDDEIARLGAFLECEARPEPGPLEENYTRLRNSNARYIAAHEGTRYGAGIWDRFGATRSDARSGPGFREVAGPKVCEEGFVSEPGTGGAAQDIVGGGNARACVDAACAASRAGRRGRSAQPARQAPGVRPGQRHTAGRRQVHPWRRSENTRRRRSTSGCPGDSRPGRSQA